MIKYLKIFPAGLLNTKKAYKIRWVLPPCWNMYPNKGGAPILAKISEFLVYLLRVTKHYKISAGGEKSILTCFYEKWTLGDDFSRFARRKCIFLKEIDEFEGRYLTILPAELLNSLTKNTRSDVSSPAPCWDMYTNRGEGGRTRNSSDNLKKDTFSQNYPFRSPLSL